MPTIAAITRSSVNPVHRQVEALAEELNAAPPQIEDEVVVEDIVFEDEAMPEPERMPEVAAINTAPRPLSRPDPERVVPQKKQGLFGLFGRQRAKVDLRQEPQPTPVAQPRATSQVIARIQPEPARPAPAPADDLFPEHKKDEQFEIPAFLRRQTN
jgi:cell division protein FtsZ